MVFSSSSIQVEEKDSFSIVLISFIMFATMYSVGQAVLAALKTVKASQSPAVPLESVRPPPQLKVGSVRSAVAF
jgi:hypothetical protein